MAGGFRRRRVFFVLFLRLEKGHIKIFLKNFFYSQKKCRFFAMISYMITAIIGCLTLVAAVGLILSGNTRASKMARIAQLSGCQFARYKETVTTQLTAGRLELFTNFFHQYRNVFTYTDHMAFIRIADDFVYKDDKPNSKPVFITLFTAELKKRQFPTFKLAPQKSLFVASQLTPFKTNVAEIDEKYCCYAPQQDVGVLFTPTFTGLLKKNSNLYVELNDNALIYHEHCLIAPEEIESFRFRAMQVLSDFEAVMARMEARTANPNQTSAEDEKQQEAGLRAEAMLKSLCAPRTAGPISSKPWRGIFAFALLLIFVGISFLSWFVLNRISGGY